MIKSTADISIKNNTQLSLELIVVGMTLPANSLVSAEYLELEDLSLLESYITNNDISLVYTSTNGIISFNDLEALLSNNPFVVSRSNYLETISAINTNNIIESVYSDSDILSGVL